MMHYIDINDDNQKQQLSSLDLPLAIYLYKEDEEGKENETDKDVFNIRIDAVKSEINDTDKSEIIAYLAEDDGHLFLQPETPDYDIFHNDEIIKQSVWIKSGDQLTVKHKIISFKISGDKIHIAVFKEPELIPPPPQQTIQLKKPDVSYSEKTVVPSISQLEEPVMDTSVMNEPPSSPVKRNLLIGSLVLLVFIAIFILFARTVSLKVEPVADHIAFNGVLPAVKIGPNYIMLSGRYELILEKEGYKKIHKTIEVDAEHTSFNFTLKELPGLVKFNITPPENNKIYIDNIVLEKPKADSNWYEIEAGKHQLSIKNKRYKPLNETILVKGKKARQEYDFKLTPDWGTVLLNTRPEKAKVILTPLSNKNETKKEQVAPVKQELLSGQYQVDISKEKYRPFRKIISLAANQEVDLGLISLDAKPAQIEFNSVPEGALLQVDGQYAGKTPIKIPLKAFKEHQYSLSLTGYKSYSGKITPEADEQRKLNITLTPEKGTVFISTSPSDAVLYIDGKRQIKSSGSFYLSGKEHTITVKAPGYTTQSKKINARNYTTQINFVLSKTINTQNTAKNTNTNTNKKSSTRKNSKRQTGSYTNSLGQKMILIQPAKFTMGSANNEIGRRSNERLHEVEITYAYYLSEKEVSNKDFKQFKSGHNSGMSLGQSLNRSVQPVVNISWDEAAAFANWLSKKEGLTPFYKKVNGKMKAKKLKPGINGYRLPFESEWAYAARGKNHQKYPWIGSFPPPDMSGNFADESVKNNLAQYIQGYNDQHKVSAPLGTYKKNSFGFYDMGGNVSEWCQDYYSPNSIFSSRTIINPVGPDKGTHHVVRDASWRDASITELRLSYRNYSKKAANDIGFRLARYAK